MQQMERLKSAASDLTRRALPIHPRSPYNRRESAYLAMRWWSEERSVLVATR